MAKSRIKELMALCAKELDKGCNPLNEQFLQDNDVTADECFTLSEQMSALINFCLSMPQDEYAEAVVVGAMHGMGESQLAKQMLNSLRLKRAADKLKDL
jgi:hypothetical protein